MEPNVFVHLPGSREDFFSRSLAYVANLFPDIGQKIIQRIAVLAGKKADHFGDFVQCDFVSHEFPGNHRASRPDLRIACSKGTIYCENKLESPLNLTQMKNHATFCKDHNATLVFISNIQHDHPQLTQFKPSGYMFPERREHYLWIDFLPAFENYYRKGSLAARLLVDFGRALHEMGMVGRRIAGASGSLYTGNSDATHLALEQLWAVLNQVGFKLAKKPPQETTLRAYPVKYGQYPLLNPGFLASAAWLDEALDRECLALTVLSKGNPAALDRRLRHFKSTQECAFIPDLYESVGYNVHGWFILPLGFVGKGTQSEIDFSALTPGLRRMLSFLKGPSGTV